MSPLLLLPLLAAASPCPAGTVTKGGSPPAELHLWCEDKAGKKEGPELEWYGPDRLKSEGGWRKGEMHGTWRAWREDGTLWLDEAYEAGSPVAPKAAAGPAVPAASPPLPAGGLLPPPAGVGAASTGGTALQRDPSRHPQAKALRSYVRALREADRKEMVAATDELFTANERLVKVGGGTSRRWAEGERRFLFTEGALGAGRLMIDLERQLIVNVVVERGNGACRELVSYPDPTGKRRTMIEESRTIDCAELAQDPELGPALAGLAPSAPPWTVGRPGERPRVERLSSLLDLPVVQHDLLKALSFGRVRYGSTVVRIVVAGPKNGRMESLDFTREEGTCEALFEELCRELGPPEIAPPGGRFSHFWKLGDREVGFEPTSSFSSEAERKRPRCDVDFGYPGSRFPRTR